MIILSVDGKKITMVAGVVGIPDRVSLCLALSEFIEVRESPPTQSSSQTQFSSGHSKHSEQLNWSHSSHSQPCSLGIKETKCGSLSSAMNTSCDLGSRDSFPRSSSYGYSGSSQDMFSRSSQNYSMSSRSSPSPFPTFTYSDKCEKQDAEVQTDPLDVCRSSPEEIQAKLTLLLKDPSFLCLVEKIKGVLPNLSPSN
ncbi:hypothetical protein GCK32_001357 [Trichostrongylus colubriformis]|uniref:Uncharacterized protein n=1 Tax=Trichostrongylus colubriformis TaxID=6319 RepID=A0AAN8FQF6_TRICO